MDNIKIKYSKPFDYSKIDRGVEWRIETIKHRKKDSQYLSNLNTQSFACPVCSKIAKNNIIRIYGFNYVQCSGCTHVYIDKIPSLETIIAYYREKNNVLQKSPGDDLINTDDFYSRVDNICIPKIEYVLEAIDKPNPKWVDIGCGVGDLVSAANKLGCDAIGYDVDEREIKHGQKFGSNIFLSEINNQNAKSFVGDADVVSLISVLEHIPNSMELLEIISKNTKPNVKIVLEVPRYESISTFVNICFPDLVSRHMLPPNHIMLFTEKSFNRLIKNAGLNKRAVWYYGMDINELFGTILSKKHNVPIYYLNKMILLFNDMQSLLDRNKFCDEMLVIADKI